MSKYSDLEREVAILRGRVQSLEYLRLNGNVYKFKARALYLDEPISPWIEGILTLQPLPYDTRTAKYSAIIEIPLRNCTTDGYEIEGPYGTRTKKRMGAQCFSAPGILMATANWDEVI